MRRVEDILGYKRGDRRFKLGRRVKEGEDEAGERVRNGTVSAGISAGQQVFLCSFLHSILGQSCSSDVACLNFGNQLLKP